MQQKYWLVWIATLNLTKNVFYLAKLSKKCYISLAKNFCEFYESSGKVKFACKTLIFIGDLDC